MNTQISTEELSALYQQGTPPAVVEALPKMYWRHTHLPGALNLPPEQVEELAPALLPDKEVLIVVYCAGPTCPHAGEVTEELTAMGYKDVREYLGGKSEWQAAGLPVEGMASIHKK
jgi:rhodanese-related sulfurtransferase